MPKTTKKRIFEWGYITRALARTRRLGLRPRNKFDELAATLLHYDLIAKLCKRVYAVALPGSVQLYYIHSAKKDGVVTPTHASRFAVVNPAARGGTQYAISANCAGTPLSKHTIFSRADSRFRPNRLGVISFFGNGGVWQEGQTDAYWNVGPKIASPSLSDVLEEIAASGGTDTWKRKASRYFRALHREARRFPDLIVRYKINNSAIALGGSGGHSIYVLGTLAFMYVHSPSKPQGNGGHGALLFSAGDAIALMDTSPKCVYAVSCNSSAIADLVQWRVTTKSSKMLSLVRELGAATVQVPC
jgi:hypothetical protein